MRHLKFNRYIVIIIAVIAAAVFLSRVVAADETTVAALIEETHFHGIAVDRADPDRIYLATHHGLFVVAPDGTAARISEPLHDFMGFTAHPSDPAILFASGHPPGGGNLGFVVSEDGGVSWSKRADGVDGPVDFHQMDVSKADPQVIYGVYGTLQKSTDGGHAWETVGRPPAGIVELAASSRDPETLYAATQQGLLQSTDGGRRWRGAHSTTRPATMVDVTADGVIHAFIATIGLVRAEEDELDWQVLADDFGHDFVIHLAVDPSDADRLYAITFEPSTHAQAVIASGDGGVTWAPLGGD